ncbi:MAG TPA: hypothetical protein H9739_05415 [Candidatus Agathobaculum pullistercoris]|nr:hypothetical protein [uncultured Agathobaculum sp.]HIX11010.1 hypothetical protein [Candidatus Agathobaculum pullistercoris]
MKIYPCLRLIWGALLAAALLNLTALSDSMPVLVAANILNLCCYGVIAYALYRLSDQSRLLARAFPTCLASVILIGLALICMQFASGNVMLVNFLSLLSLAGSISNLLSEYFMYWGLDERILLYGYAFPARRIRWCLYAPLLGSFAASLLLLSWQVQLGTLVQTVCQLVPVVLLWQYMRAVKSREDDPLVF